jgi:hypothetical protein
MLKKALFLLILCLSSITASLAQYEDDAPPRKTSADTAEDGIGDIWKDKITPGLEFMVTANGGAFFAELSPFVGYRVLDPVLMGVGVHGSFLGASNYGNFTYFGGFAFGRLIIAEQFFIQGEYRMLNGGVPGSLVRRQWVGSPIAAVGIMYGDASWMTIGYAFNTDYQSINPMRGFVYRIGLYF